MVLSDVDIIERIGNDLLVIDPYEEDNVEPASVDLLLGSGFKRVVQTDEWDTGAYDFVETDESVLIDPGEFVLATTKERVEIPDDIVAHVLGRSSLGRLGISVHQTAGYIDPGFEGQITLELSNHGPAPVRLHADDRICQIVFEELSSPALEPYGHDGSQYQGQRGATESGMRFD